MRIKWLDDVCEHAVITRGFWRWKRVAEVRYVYSQRANMFAWRYVPTEDFVGVVLADVLDSQAWKERRRRKGQESLERNWKREPRVQNVLPGARVVSS